MVSRASAGPRVNQAPMWIAFITPKPATTTHSQVLPGEDRPALAQVAEHARVLGAAARRERDPGQQQGGGQPGQRVEGERPARADA